MKSCMKWTIGLVTALLVMSGTTASADEGFIELRGGSVAQGDVDQALAPGSPAGGLGMAVGYELRAVPGLRLMASFDGQGFTARRFDGDVRATWSASHLMPSVDWGVNLVGDWLRPLVRGGFGYAHQSLRLTADNVTYQATDHGLVGRVAGGLEASVGRSSDGDGTLDRLSLGANLLIGYTWQSEAEFDEMETTETIDDDDPWQRGTYDAGSMQVSGASWSLGVVMGYRF